MGAYTSRLANEKVKWETSEQYNLGIDARFLRQRLSLTFDTYIKNTKDWLVQAPVLATAGTQGPVINGGDVKNKGVELGLSWNDQIGKDFVYSVGANFAYNHNEVGNIPTLDGIIHGLPIRFIRMQKSSIVQRMVMLSVTSGVTRLQVSSRTSRISIIGLLPVMVCSSQMYSLVM